MISRPKIKKLAHASFKNAQLDAPRVRKISKLLKKEELKYYIKALKQIENKKTITLVVSDEDIDSVANVVEKIRKIYPDKKILIKTDPTLIAGIKVINDDLIYEVSVKQILEDYMTKL